MGPWSLKNEVNSLENAPRYATDLINHVTIYNRKLRMNRLLNHRLRMLGNLIQRQGLRYYIEIMIYFETWHI